MFLSVTRRSPRYEWSEAEKTTSTHSSLVMPLPATVSVSETPAAELSGIGWFGVRSAEGKILCAPTGLEVKLGRRRRPHR
jgi:hypothetical protein